LQATSTNNPYPAEFSFTGEISNVHTKTKKKKNNFVKNNTFNVILIIYNFESNSLTGKKMREGLNYYLDNGSSE